MERETAVIYTLKIGLAFAFVYAAVAAWLQPLAWIGYIPAFMRGVVADEILLGAIGLFQIGVAAWLLLGGRRIFIPSVLAALYLLGIVFFQWSQLAVIFRDITILSIAVALAIWSYRGQFGRTSRDNARDLPGDRT